MSTGDTRTELLFSYGTLHLESVQLATFGRRLEGREDVMVGFDLVPLEIEDEAVIEVSGKAVHTMARFTGRDSDRIRGTVFRLSMDEIASADGYEVPAVRRVSVRLRSGARAWAYVDARNPPEAG